MDFKKNKEKFLKKYKFLDNNYFMRPHNCYLWTDIPFPISYMLPTKKYYNVVLSILNRYKFFDLFDVAYLLHNEQFKINIKDEIETIDKLIDSLTIIIETSIVNDNLLINIPSLNVFVLKEQRLIAEYNTLEILHNTKNELLKISNFSTNNEFTNYEKELKFITKEYYEKLVKTQNYKYVAMLFNFINDAMNSQINRQLKVQNNPSYFDFKNYKIDAENEEQIKDKKETYEKEFIKELATPTSKSNSRSDELKKDLSKLFNLQNPRYEDLVITNNYTSKFKDYSILIDYQKKLFYSNTTDY